LENEVRGVTVVDDGKEKEWLRLVVAILFVVTVVGVFSYLFRDQPATAKLPGVSTVLKDSFERKAGLIESGKGNQVWSPIRGVWSVAAGAAFVSEPAPFFNVAVVDSGLNASMKAAVSGRGFCGIVANYVDQKNFLSLVRVEQYGIWNLELHRNGTAELIATIGGTKNVMLRASIAVEAPIVTATVGDQHVSVSIPDLALGTSAGLYAADPNPSDCAFDDVVISRPN